MIDMNWIERKRTVQIICREQYSYFERPEEQAPIYHYEVRSLPGFRKLLEERLGDAFTSAERLEIAKLTFQNKPLPSDSPARKDLEISDFIYQL